MIFLAHKGLIESSQSSDSQIGLMLKLLTIFKIKEVYMKSVFILLMVMTSIAMADQCADLTEKQARLAAAEILKANKIHQLCEPCGEIIPKQLEVLSVTVGERFSRFEKGSSFEVIVSGRFMKKSIDAAYLYVNGKNLAMQIGCPVEAVSDQLVF